MEGILRETISGVTEDTTKVVSEDEGTMVSIEDIVCQEGDFSKGSAKQGCLHSKQNTLCMSNCSPYPKNKIEKDCAVLFQDLCRNRKNQIDTVFAEENCIRIPAVVKNISSIKNLVVKTKIYNRRGLKCTGFVDSMLH